MASITKNLSRGIGGLTTDLDLIAGIKDTITNTLKTELQYLIAPIENELMNVINTLLAPIMPYLQGAVNLITSSIHAWFDYSDTGMWASAGREYEASSQLYIEYLNEGGTYGNWDEFREWQEARENRVAEPTGDTSSQISGSRINRMLRFENSGVTGGTLKPKTSTISSRLGEFE